MSEQPIAAADGPIEVEGVAGKDYWWCACGRSKSQPLCDGSHKGTGLAPLKVTAEEDGSLWFCGCKATKTPPFCDGSHNDL